jgi:hypothetical protein
MNACEKDARSKLNSETPLYSELDIDYQQAYSGPYKDLSYYGDDAIVIAAIKENIITGFGRPVVAFGDENRIKKEFNRLYDISRNIRFLDYLEGGRLSAASKFLLQKGLTAEPVFTQIIDLTKSEKELYSDLRKSFKQLIKQQDCYQYSLNNLRQLHFLRHGETRSRETWDIQQKMIQEKQAFVVGHASNTEGALVLIYYNEYSAYYASVGANVNAHSALWSAIWEAKNNGCKTFEIGEQLFFGDEKQVRISNFKRGFGGQTKVRLLIKDEQ